MCFISHVGRLDQRCRSFRIDEVLECGNSMIILHMRHQIPPNTLGACNSSKNCKKLFSVFFAAFVLNPSSAEILYTKAHRWLFLDSPPSLRTLWFSVIKSPNFSARSTASPELLLWGGMQISHFRFFQKMCITAVLPRLWHDFMCITAVLPRLWHDFWSVLRIWVARTVCGCKQLCDLKSICEIFQSEMVDPPTDLSRFLVIAQEPALISMVQGRHFTLIPKINLMQLCFQRRSVHLVPTIPAVALLKTNCFQNWHMCLERK